MRAAGVSGEGQALAVDAVTGALLVQVGGHGGHLLHRAGELGLGRQTVVDGHHRHAGMACQDAAHAVVRVEVAQHEPAAVHVHDGRHGGLPCRTASSGCSRGIVVAHRNGAVGAVHLGIELLGHDRSALAPERAAGHVVLAHFLEAHAGIVRVARQLVLFGEHGLHLRVDLREHVELVHCNLLSRTDRCGMVDPVEQRDRDAGTLLAAARPRARWRRVTPWRTRRPLRPRPRRRRRSAS